MCPRGPPRGWVELRDDKVPFGGAHDRRIVLTVAEFDEFQAGIRAGRRDGLALRLSRRLDGTYQLGSLRPRSAPLVFTEPEIRAFLAGVHAHEFDRTRYPESATAA